MKTTPPAPLPEGRGEIDEPPEIERVAIVRGAKVQRVKVEQAKAMRRAPTDSEALAWSILRRRGVLNLKFRRQQVIRGFIVDFYCAEHRIALEIDGGIHTDANVRQQDEQRTHVLHALGIRVVRIHNDDVNKATLERLLTLAVSPLP